MKIVSLVSEDDLVTGEWKGMVVVETAVGPLGVPVQPAEMQVIQQIIDAVKSSVAAATTKARPSTPSFVPAPAPASAPVPAVAAQPVNVAPHLPPQYAAPAEDEYPYEAAPPQIPHVPHTQVNLPFGATYSPPPAPSRPERQEAGGPLPGF